MAGTFGLALALVNPSATAVWPPTGIALSAALVFGRHVWPGIFVGAFLTNYLTAGTLVTSLLIAAGNTLEALAGAYLVNRFAGGLSAFSTGRNIFRYVWLAGLVSTAISASVGTTTLVFAGLAAQREAFDIWLTWWLGDASAAVLVAPALVLWYLNPSLAWPRRQRFEVVTLAIAAAAIGWAVFVRLPHPLPFLCIPVFLWAALRFGQREAMTAACIVSAFAIWGTLHGQGSLAGAPLNTQLLLLQSFMATAALVGLTVGAAHSELEHRISERTRDLGGALDELRYSERRLQTIIDAEPACVKLVSTDGILLEMNPAGLQMLGAAAAADVIGRSVVDVVHPEDRERFLQAHRSAAAGTPGRSEFRIVGLDGSERSVDSHLVPFDMTLGGVARRAVLSVTSDVTERKRLEDQLRQSQKLEAVGMLAGGIAHDFNNLLTAIGGFTDIVLGTLPAGDERRDDLQEVAKAAQRGAALTRQLLAVSRRQILQPSVLDVNDVVADVQKLLRRTIPRNIDVQLELGSNLGLVRADRGQIEQVLLNLAINAGDAMPEGGRLRLATSMVTIDEAAARRHPPMSPGCYVRLTVSDTGAGMTPEVRAHVFEPFFTTKDQGKGTGLGLATVYGIVKQSGGFIWLDSTPRKGTIFDIYLPVVPEGRGEMQDVPASPGDQAQRSHTILLAEDDGAVRRLARDVLTRHGYTVLDARDGEEALALADQRRDAIHLLITDMVMPGLSGRDLAARVGAQRPGMRVLYITGYSERFINSTGVEEGLVLLLKPFLPADLLRKVSEALSVP